MKKPLLKLRLHLNLLALIKINPLHYWSNNLFHYGYSQTVFTQSRFKVLNKTTFINYKFDTLN